MLRLDLWFEWVFRQYGFPQAIRTDNGAPFASLAIGGLSELSKWWIQLGIRHELIKPGKPSQNGHSRGQTVLHLGCTGPHQYRVVSDHRDLFWFRYSHFN